MSYDTNGKNVQGAGESVVSQRVNPRESGSSGVDYPMFAPLVSRGFRGTFITNFDAFHPSIDTADSTRCSDQHDTNE